MTEINDREVIPCPDNKPGCCVLHYKYRDGADPNDTSTKDNKNINTLKISL